MSDELEQLHPAIRALKVVCRCNNIKYRTIERAIEGGAATVGAVARQTLATTGHCGGSCTPKIQAMIDSRNGAHVAPAEEPSDLDAWWIRHEEAE